MNINTVNATIGMSPGSHSILLVDPREAFVQWLTSFKRARGLEAYDILFEQENSVWIIPSIHLFTRPGELDEYLVDIKPKMLLSELHRFGANEGDLPAPITAESFDTYLSMSLRDEAHEITEIC